MYSYWYKDIHGKTPIHVLPTQYVVTDNISDIAAVAHKEEFKAFEWQHKPTRFRMITSAKHQTVYPPVTFGVWRS